MAKQKITINQIDAGVRSTLIVSSRDASAASGDISYTGVGFMPTKITALMRVDGTLYRSDGVADSARANNCTYQSSANVYYENNGALVSYTNYSGWAQSATVKSYDADGFTLTWTKISTPAAGTIKMAFLCER